VTNTAGTVTSAGGNTDGEPRSRGTDDHHAASKPDRDRGTGSDVRGGGDGTAPLSYQWRKNGVNIAGATATSYTTPATATSDSGSTFSVVVTNTAGTVTSAAATLTVNPAPAPAMQVNPTSINFGNAVVGINLSQVLIIKNTGTATLTISQVTSAGSGFSVSGFSLPLNVSAGQQTTITVDFLPTVVGSASGNISIGSNAPTSPTSVGLSGTGIAATFILSISPTSLNFGNITTGTSSAAQSVIITNTGNSNVGDLADHLERSRLHDDRREWARDTYSLTNSHRVCAVRSHGPRHCKWKRLDPEQRHWFTCNHPSNGNRSCSRAAFCGALVECQYVDGRRV